MTMKKTKNKNKKDTSMCIELARSRAHVQTTTKLSDLLHVDSVHNRPTHPDPASNCKVVSIFIIIIDVISFYVACC